MRKTNILAMAALMSAGLSAPALADYVRLGSVDVGYRVDRDTSWNRFGGGMEGLRLVADKSDVKCRSVVVQFGDGSTQNVFSGQLREDRPVAVDLRGGTRYVRFIRFVCRSDERSGGKIYIAAEVGRFRDEWRRSPDWALYWSHLFNWETPAMDARSGYDPNYWVSLGTARFDGRDDRETAFADGWSGRNVERIGLKAVNDDARCSRMRVSFGNGTSTMLDVGRLDQGRLMSIDLPGGNRNVQKVNLVCRPLNKNGVAIEIFARK